MVVHTRISGGIERHISVVVLRDTYQSVVVLSGVLLVCVCVLALQKKAIQKSNKDIEKEAEDGTVYTDNTEISFTNFTVHVWYVLEFMKTLLLMEATLKAENEVRCTR